MDSKPLVSVIIPTISTRKNELKNAIQSVMKQTYSNIEIIIIRNNKNVQNARNLGVSKSKGKYIAFLDDDDKFYSTKIEKQVKFMEKNKLCPLCFTGVDDCRFGMHQQYLPKELWNFKDLINGFNITGTSTFMVRKYIFELLGGMDESLLDSHEYDLALRLSRWSNIFCIQEILTKFNEGNDCNMSYDYTNKIKGMIQFIRKYGYYFNLKRWLRTIVCLSLFHIGLICSKPIQKIFIIIKTKTEKTLRLKND